MDLLYPEEHTSCFHYQKGKDNIIQKIEVLKGEKCRIPSNMNKIIFLLKGRLSVSFEKHLNQRVLAGEFFFFPPQDHYICEAVESATLLLFTLNIDINFCDHSSLEMLVEKGRQHFQKEFVVLKTNNILKQYLDLLVDYETDGLKCTYLFELKIKELLFLLRAYYTKESLYAFFSPMLTNDVEFSNKVHQNYIKIKSVKELAKLLNYSPSGFEKRFKRVFGMPAYQWIKTKKARSIYHEINCTKKTFSEIGFEYGFSSSSYFNDFCKANFGMTPGEIRSKNFSLKGSELNTKEKIA